MKHLGFFSCAAVLLAGAVSAEEFPRFAFNIGGGFTEPVGNTGRHLDMGWNVDTGAGYNFSSHVGVMAQFNYNSFGINSTTLNNLGFPDGRVRFWSATLDPIVHLNPKGPMDVYLIGGGGLYHRTQEFTQPTVAVVTGFDPFFGFFPVAVSAHQVLAAYSVNKPGVNGGIGISFGTKRRAKFYAEARYHRMFIGDRHTDVLPVTFGVRW